MASDPRITPARPDLAAAHLRGKVEATRFAEGAVREVVTPQAPMRRAASHEAPLDTEALQGERVTVYETTDEGWSWGQLDGDGYVGWLPAQALGPLAAALTHRVSTLRTFVFPAPSIKLTPLHALPFGTRVAIARMEGVFGITAGGGYIPAVHLVPIGHAEADFVAVAERFLGAPYLWGGKTSLGIDCSGLVQVALTACGQTCPRDSDMQEQALGAPLDVADALKTLRRGDLVFWSGHVAIARDGATLIHANAHHMTVASEAADEAVARILKSGSGVTSVRRL